MKPSPITPPYLPSTASSPHARTAPRKHSRAATHTDLSSSEQAQVNAAPLKTFVHEVLRPMILGMHSLLRLRMVVRMMSGFGNIKV
jgi:hypothetical protein